MFGKRFHLLKLFGIPIGIDLSWLLIAALLSWTLATGYFPIRYPGFANSSYWGMGILGMLGLFVCILLHELGHALVAKHYKLPTTQITLFLFGGVAQIQKEPDSPKVELLVAIAGPIVSVFLCICLFFLTHIGQTLGWPTPVIGITSYLMMINAVIVLFNLIPAFPLDGGRVLRSLLWMKTKNLAWATKVCANIGLGFGFFLIFFGIFSFLSGNLIGGLWLVILGLFLQKASFGSKTQYYITRELKTEIVEKFMKKEVETISPYQTVQELLEKHFYVSHHHLYPVVLENNLLGYISLKEIKGIPPEQWRFKKAEEIMVPLSDLLIVDPGTSALKALNLMQEVEMPTLFVVKESHFLGILTSKDLFQLISLKLELEE